MDERKTELLERLGGEGDTRAIASAGASDEGRAQRAALATMPSAPRGSVGT